jgi:hypothetical protein
MSIPDGLLNALQSRIKDGSWADKPRIVALGADDNFLLITEKNTAIWDLENYKAISDMLEVARAQTPGIRDIQNIVLHPHRYGCFVAQFKNGLLKHENLPPHQRSGIANMADPVLRDTASVARKTIQRRESDRQESVQRTQSPLQRTQSPLQRTQSPQQRTQSPLQERARIKREWCENSHRYTAQSRGLKLSLNISIGGLARMLG